MLQNGGCVGVVSVVHFCCRQVRRHDERKPTMATDTLTVKVSDMATGALLRMSTTAGEALRASQLPTAGMNIAQRQAVANGYAMTDTQVASLARKAERNALRMAEREALALMATLDKAEVSATLAHYGNKVENLSDMQAGYDY
jgi:hypothetical protein